MSSIIFPLNHCFVFRNRQPTIATFIYNDKRLLSKHLDDMLYIQSKTDVRVSALFNNIYVPPNLETLEIFIKNFRPIYEKGIRSITQPHSLWMYYGRIKEEFPDLTIKDTVLRRTRNGMDFWNAAKLGFDYVNLDRLLLRDFKLLKDIKKAQLKFQKMYGKYVYLSILVGERCDGTCPFWEEHYQHTMTHPKILSENPAVNAATHYKIAHCDEKPLFALNRVFNSPFREDLDELSQYIDVIKYPGRRTKVALADAVWFIEQIKSCIKDNKSDFLTALDFSDGMITKIWQSEKPEHKNVLQKWRKLIKNCAYQCWNCDYCYKIARMCVEGGLVTGIGLKL